MYHQIIKPRNYGIDCDAFFGQVGFLL